jgi:hypothetical protein
MLLRIIGSCHGVSHKQQPHQPVWPDEQPMQDAPRVSAAQRTPHTGGARHDRAWDQPWTRMGQPTIGPESLHLVRQEHMWPGYSCLLVPCGPAGHIREFRGADRRSSDRRSGTAGEPPRVVQLCPAPTALAPAEVGSCIVAFANRRAWDRPTDTAVSAEFVPSVPGARPHGSISVAACFL